MCYLIVVQSNHLSSKNSYSLFYKLTVYSLYYKTVYNSYLNYTCRQHKVIVQNQNPRLGKKDIELIHSRTFSKWFMNYVSSLSYYLIVNTLLVMFVFVYH